MKRIIAAIALVLCLSVMTPVKAATVAISAAAATVKVNKTTTLKIKNTTRKVTWSSSNKKIAKVSSAGKVTGVKPGKATIKAKVKGLSKTYKCKVTVTAWMSASSATLYALRTKTLTLYGTTVKSYSSSDTAIATVSKSSTTKVKSTAKKKGTATITVKGKNGKTYTCALTVKYYPVTVGKVADATDLLGTSSSGFTTSDESIALVDRAYGVIVPVSKGVCTIANGSKKIKISVTDNEKVKVGVDVSKWQSTIDVDKLKANNLDFVILRGGHGDEKDTKFATFVKQLYKGEMPFGIYWYFESHTSGRMSVDDATEEAEALVALLKSYKTNENFNEYFQLPIYMDLESASLYTGLSKAKAPAHIQSLCEAFTTVLENNGYTNYSIYAGKYFTETYLNNAYFASFAAKYWHARYGYTAGTPTVTINGKTISPNIWQVGSQFSVAGTGSTNTDVDYYYQ